MGRKDMTARCDAHARKQIRKLLPRHKCSTDRDAKPINVDLLNQYCIKIGVADPDVKLFCPNTPISVCNTIHKAVAKKMGPIDLLHTDRRLEREAAEAEREAAEAVRWEQVRRQRSLRSSDILI